MYHYTVYEVDIDNNCLNKEHLNANELDDWMDLALERFATVKVVRSDEKFIIYDLYDLGWTIRQRG